MAEEIPRAMKDPVANDLEGGGIEGGDEQSRIAWERWRLGSTHLKDWLVDASENFDFVAGAQWSEEDLSALKEQQRTPIVFNRMMAMIAAVSGYEINGRQEVTYLPREPSLGSPQQMMPAVPQNGGMPPAPGASMPPGPVGAPGPVPASSGPPMQQPRPQAPPQDHDLDELGEADVDTKAAKYFRQECDAEDEESEQFRDMLVTGMGWIEHRMDYEEDPDGMMKVERVDPMEMRHDPAALRPNIVDRAWDIRGKWWDKDKAKRKWRKADFDTPMPEVYNGQDLDGQPPIDRLAASFYQSPGVGEHAQRRKNKVFILEHTWYELEDFYTVVNPTTGKTEDVEPQIHDKLQELLEERGLPRARSTRRNRRRYKRSFVYARQTLEEGDAPCPDHFHYQCITGHRNRNKNTWFGLALLMKDPQRWANKWLSQFLHMLNTNVKTGFWYEEGAFDNVGGLEEKLAKPGFVQKVNAGFLEKIRKEEPAPIPPDAMQLMQHAIQSIRDAAGPGLEAMGQQTNDQPGVVEVERKKAVMNILAPFFSAQRQYRKIAGRITLYFIRTYLSDGRWIRIVGPANAKYVQLAKREESVKYDIIVDESPSSPNQKEAVFGTLSMIMPALLKEGIPIPPDIVDYIPGLPAQLAEKWKQIIQQKANQPPPPDPKTQVAMAKLANDKEESQRQDQIDMGRLAFDKLKLQVEQLMQERQMRMDQDKIALEREKLGSHEKEHLATLAHDTITQHREHAHEQTIAQQDRAHERIMGQEEAEHVSAEAAEDRAHASSESAEDRQVTREGNKLKAKAKPKPKGKK